MFPLDDNMKLKLYVPFKNLNVIFALFDTQYDLCSTMIRIQEYYESDSSKFRGKIFELDAYMDYYAKKHGNFTYFSDWRGFNIPSDIYYKWNTAMSLGHHLWRDKESMFVDEIFECCDNNRIGSMDKFYLISCYKGESGLPKIDIFKHEVSHAMFYLNKEYRRESTKILNNMIDTSIRDEMSVFLANRGYGRNVFTDEMVAYISTSDIEMLAPKINMQAELISDQCSLLRNLYVNYIEIACMKHEIRKFLGI